MTVNRPSTNSAVTEEALTDRTVCANKVRAELEADVGNFDVPSALERFELNNRDDVVLRKAWSFWYGNLPHHFRELDQKFDPFLNTDHSPIPFPWLRAVRRALMLTAKSVAEKAGVSRSTFAEIEAAEVHGTITLETLRKYADAMDYEVIFGIRPKSCTRFSGIIWDRLQKEAKAHVENQLGAVTSEKPDPLRLKKEMMYTSTAWEKPMVRKKNKWTNRQPV